MVPRDNRLSTQPVVPRARHRPVTTRASGADAAVPLADTMGGGRKRGRGDPCLADAPVVGVESWAAVARTVSDILRRFRPAVAPGPAAPAGVPVDRVAEAEAELAAVFAALEPAVAEAQAMRGRAGRDAAERRRAAAEEAERIVADARASVDAVRAAAAAARLAALDEERAALDEEARVEAERVARVAGERLPAIVARVVEGVWATAGLPVPEP